ncbi:MAG: TraR/DksA family transcriptional regulator [Planctomycetota bacterium]
MRSALPNGKKSNTRSKKTVLLPKGKGVNHSPIPVVQAELDAPVPKTLLTSKQLREFKDLLLAKRSEMVRDVLTLTDEALYRQRDGFTNEHSAMPIHMADVGSDNWEQEFTLGLVENERARLREIDEALDRIEDKTYGVCLATYSPISLARLRAQPWTKHCIDYARMRDEGRLH